jgi:hypothetical protein
VGWLTQWRFGRKLLQQDQDHPCSSAARRRAHPAVGTRQKGDSPERRPPGSGHPVCGCFTWDLRLPERTGRAEESHSAAGGRRLPANKIGPRPAAANSCPTQGTRLKAESPRCDHPRAGPGKRCRTGDRESQARPQRVEESHSSWGWNTRHRPCALRARTHSKSASSKHLPASAPVLYRRTGGGVRQNCRDLPWLPHTGDCVERLRQVPYPASPKW